MSTTPIQPQRMTIDGVEIDLVRHGSGQPLVWLHGVEGINTAAPWFQELSSKFEVIAPWHPGFGHSQWPKEFRSVSDLAYFHMTLLDELGIENAILVGSSFGGWLAAEIAVRSTQRLAALVLIDAYGIKVGGREDRDIADLYSISQDEVARLAYHDPTKRARDYSTMSEHDLLAIARSREAFTYFGWKPYMHNPGLARWLRRIDVPTMVIWGDSDGIVTPGFGRAYAKLIPTSEFVSVPQAGHYPHIEQPEATVEHIVNFSRRALPDHASEALTA
jgi:pimeloyl-ACP methyl ester carboxylesterase